MLILMVLSYYQKTNDFAYLQSILPVSTHNGKEWSQLALTRHNDNLILLVFIARLRTGCFEYTGYCFAQQLYRLSQTYSTNAVNFVMFIIYLSLTICYYHNVLSYFFLFLKLKLSNIFFYSFAKKLKKLHWNHSS